MGEVQNLAVRLVVSVLAAGASLQGADAAAAAVAAQPAAEAALAHAIRLIGRRRLGHATEVLELAASEADLPLDALIETTLRDEEHQEFLVRLMIAAQDVAAINKRRALARALAAAAAGDDARLDDEFLFVRAIADLDNPHIRLLVRLNTDREGEGQLVGPRVRDGWTPRLLEVHEPGLADSLPALIKTLEGHGLATHPANWSYLEGSPMYQITMRGQAMLERLSTD